MKKCIIYLLVTAILTVSLCGCSAIEEAQEKKNGTEGLNFILSGDKQSYYCTGFGLVPDGPAYVVVPAEYNGKPVTGIAADAFAWEPELAEIILPDTITFIGEDAFIDVKNMTSITIPDSVTEIGENAFAMCSNLELVYISTDGWENRRGQSVDFSDPKEVAKRLKEYTAYDGVAYSRVTEENE